MYCRSCGKQINHGDVYCPVCGVKQQTEQHPAATHVDTNQRPGWMENSERPFAHIQSEVVEPTKTASAGVIAIIILFVLIGGTIAVVTLNGHSGASPHTITGRLSLHDTSESQSGIVTYGTSCSGAGGYSDIGSGTQVTVTNESGKVLATSSLGVGSGVIVCDFDFTVKVPNASFYRIEIGGGRRGVMTYSRQQMEDAGWSVNLTLGS